MMSDFIPKTGAVKSGLGPKAQKLAALREKAAAQGKSGGAVGSGTGATAVKAKSSFAGKKTAFQRKAV